MADQVTRAIAALERREAPARAAARREREAWAGLIEHVLTTPAPRPPSIVERIRSLIRRLVRRG